jgi:hypothetical protein
VKIAPGGLAFEAASHIRPYSKLDQSKGRAKGKS